MKTFDRFDFYHQPLIDEQIEPLMAQQPSAIPHRITLFRFERNASFTKLEPCRRRIHAFAHTGTQLAMDRSAPIDCRASTSSSGGSVEVILRMVKASCSLCLRDVRSPLKTPNADR